jgi:hypothetical protein
VADKIQADPEKYAALGDPGFLRNHMLDVQMRQSNLDEMAIKIYDEHLAPAHPMKAQDVTLDRIDEIIDNLNDLQWTPAGYDRYIKNRFKGAITRSRRALNDLMETVPEGEKFVPQKMRLHYLESVRPTRSALEETLGKRLVIGGLGTAIAGQYIHPGAEIVGLLVAAAGLATKPSTYAKLLGMIKAPNDMAEGIVAAAKMAKLTDVAAAVNKYAVKYPTVTERFIRGLLILSGKPSGQEFLTKDEAKSLDGTKDFDLESVNAEIMRLQQDDSIPSDEKAKKITEINKRGYVDVEMPKDEPVLTLPPTPPRRDSIITLPPTPPEKPEPPQRFPATPGLPFYR